MCRNIRVLHNFVPPTSPEEIRASALQFVRKVSGINKPSKADEHAFEHAVEDVTAVTTRLLGSLHPHGKVRTREEEAAKGRARWQQREARLSR